MLSYILLLPVLSFITLISATETHQVIISIAPTSTNPHAPTEARVTPMIPINAYPSDFSDFSYAQPATITGMGVQVTTGPQMGFARLELDGEVFGQRNLNCRVGVYVGITKDVTFTFDPLRYPHLDSNRKEGAYATCNPTAIPGKPTQL